MVCNNAMDAVDCNRWLVTLVADIQFFDIYGLLDILFSMHYWSGTSSSELGISIVPYYQL